jgi:lon-related putative ATP-dependent protease
MSMLRPLPWDRLYRSCDPTTLGFRTTADLDVLSDGFGQDRAVEAVRFGVAIRHAGYNLFALGPAGTGKHTLVRRYVEERAATEPVPSDWCYVNNFTEPHKPRAMRLPAGRGVPLRAAMERLVEDVRATISAAFRGEDYEARKRAIEQELEDVQERAFTELRARAAARDAALIRTPVGFAFAPMHNGEVVGPEEFRKLPPEKQQQIKKAVEELEEELQAIMKQVPQWQRTHREETRKLDHEVTRFAVDALIEQMKADYADLPEIVGYLDEVRDDIVEHADDFMPTEPGGTEGGPMMALRHSLMGPPSFRRYQANVIVDHGKTAAAPVVFELRPTQPNLVGRIEHVPQNGLLTTDFNLIKPGALHAANGGYLIVDARKILMQPYAWEELKRALQAREIRTQGISEAMGFSAMISLDPEPIPLDVKVVLLGDRMLYYLLGHLDPEFPELFKVTVDFDEQVDRTPENDRLFARLVATIANREGLRPFDSGGVARVIEHAARIVEDADKVTLHLRSIADLLCEADHWAAEQGRKVVDAASVQHAIDAQVRRVDRIRARSQEAIARGTVLIATEGGVVGQVNGLAVLQLGEFTFGRPNRITARVRLGRGEVLDIEREVALGGPIHSKGVLILSGFLGQRFGHDGPLALSASLVFEQSYGGVEGDSASSAELYALLSALSGLPIMQGYAVTGSVNQRGEVQAVGGVNEKIEGFFDVCAARGLTGEQGVLIPAANVQHLMLRREVIEAVRAEKFRIYAVATIDEGIEVLTGVSAGEPDADGEYPEGTVNHAIRTRVRTLAKHAQAFARSPATGEGATGGEAA